MNKQQHTKQKEQHRDRTQPQGQNPKVHDSPDHDEHHDESRRNMYDPEVAEALKRGDEKKH